MPIAPLILTMLVNLLLSFKSSNNKKYLSLMSSVIVVTAQEKSQLNVAKEEFLFTNCFQQKSVSGTIKLYIAAISTSIC
jgi:hypothetical protein